MKRWNQLIKFGIVGVANNGIYYLAYLLLIRLNVHYLAASTAAFLISVGNACYWNSNYVFTEKNQEQPPYRCWWKLWLKTLFAYAGTGLILNNLLLVFWIDFCGIRSSISPMINLCITVPVNFLINKYWTFRSPK